MDETTRLVIATSMRNMIEGGYLSISTIDECLKLAGIIPHGTTYSHLRALHCIHFKNMPRELADKLPGMLKEVFNGLNVEAMMQAVIPAEKNNGATAIARLVR